MAKTTKLQVTIADTVKLQACRAIDNTYKAFIAKGGIKELSERLEAIKENKAGEIYALAVTANKLAAGNQDAKKASPTWTEAYFKEMCKTAETHLKEKLGNIENLAKEFPIWSVYKSEIRRALDVGLLPVNFDSYSAYKAARVETDRKTRESNAMKTGARAEGEAAGSENAAGGAGSNVAAAMGEAKVTPVLAATLRVMQGAIAGMDADTQDKFAKELSELVAKYGQAVQPKAEKVDSKAAQAA